MDDPTGGAVAAAMRAALPPGELEEIETGALDVLGLPVISCTFFPAAEAGPGTPVTSSHGYGATPGAARTGALGELTEESRLSATTRRRRPRRADYASLLRERGPQRVADPLTLVLPAGSPYTADRPLDWLPARRWTAGSGPGEEVLVPAELVGVYSPDLPAGPPPGGWLAPLITNGLGAGDCIERAVAHGLLELLQRDGNGLRFRALDPGVVLDLGGPDWPEVRDPATRDALRRLAAAGVEVLPKLATTELGIPNVYVVGCEPAGVEPPQPIMVTAAGEAAHPDREAALRKAVLEFAAARTRKAWKHGSLAQAQAVAPAGYLPRWLARGAGASEPRALAAMVAWASSSADRLREHLAPAVLSRRSSVRFCDLPTTTGEDPATVCDLVLRRLADAGFDVLVVDCSGDGVAAVKVVVPGLEVETMSYGRIGERGVAELLAQDRDDLAGLGEPPAGAAPVLLTDAAQDRLGGPAWFSPKRAAEVVGPLYPLYREPGRHAAALALASPLHPSTALRSQPAP